MRKFSPSLSSLCLPSLTHFEMNYVVPSSCAPSSVLFPCLPPHRSFSLALSLSDLPPWLWLCISSATSAAAAAASVFLFSLAQLSSASHKLPALLRLARAHTHSQTVDVFCRLPALTFLSFSNGTAVNVTNAGLDKHWEHGDDDDSRNQTFFTFESIISACVSLIGLISNHCLFSTPSTSYSYIESRKILQLWKSLGFNVASTNGERLLKVSDKFYFAFALVV